MVSNLLISVDVESDGPCPGLYSMVSFGAVVVERMVDRTFYGRTGPLPDAQWDPQALTVSNTTRAQHVSYPTPRGVMKEFDSWLLALGAKRLTFVSDNPAFDWQWINYYFHRFVGANPFGHTARRIGDLWAGYRLKFNDHSSWKDLRKTRHTHNPVDDARGNAEALLDIMERLRGERR